MRLIAKMRGINVKNSTRKIELFRILKKEPKITYKGSRFKSIIQDIKDKLSKSGDKLIKKGLYSVEEMKKLTESQVKNIKEKLIKLKKKLIRKNRIKKIRTYNGIKDIRYLFNEDEDEGDIKYFFSEDEDKITYKESPLKSIIADIRNKLSKNGNKMIKKGLYYVEKIKELTKSQVHNIKEKLIKFKNELIRKNKINNRIKKDLNNYNGIIDIRYLFNEYEDEYEDIRYLFNEYEDLDEDKITCKESPFKSITVDIRNKLGDGEDGDKDGDKLIKKGLYYVEGMKSLGSAKIKNIKEKSIIFENELIRKNRINKRIKKDLDDYNGIKDI